MAVKVFLLHGMGGAPADWRFVQQSFAGEALHFAPAPDFAGVTEALCARLREERAPYGLAGYSLGGRVALAASARLVAEGSPAPRRLALLGAGLGFASAEERTSRRARDEAWGRLVRQDPARFWKQWYGQELFASFAELPERTRADWLSARATLAPDVLARQLNGWSPTRHEYLGPALRSVLAAGTSVLYLSGERDKKYVALARELAREGVAAEIIPNAGHLLPLEAPAAVAQALSNFFHEGSSHG